MTVKNTGGKETKLISNVVGYTAYPWGHALTALRLEEPLRQAGLQFVRGNDFDLNGNPGIDPARVDLADLVVIQRDFPRFEQGYRAVIERARQQSKVVIYEADDLLLELPDDHPDRRIHYYSRAAFPMLRAILDADAVTASTPALGDYLSKLNPNTWVLPNYLIDRFWSLAGPPRPDNSGRTEVVIGYMGTASHAYDLEMIRPVLERLIQRHGSQIALKFWGAEPPTGIIEGSNDSINVEWAPVQIMDYEEFAAFFSSQTCDIFIAPLTDSPFNRTKSSIKYLEYSTLGIPGVYSAITPYQCLVEQGVNGFLASSLEEWENYLQRLIENPVLREEIGQSARATVRQNWLLSEHAHEWPDTYAWAAQRAQEEKPEQRSRRVMIAGISSYVQEWQQTLEEQLERDQQTIRLLEAQIQDKNLLLQEREHIILSQSIGETIDAYLKTIRQGVPVENLAEVTSHFRAIARQIVSRIRPSNQAPFTVLDLGCGAGLLVEAFRQQGIEATGIESSEASLQNLRQTARPFCVQAALTDPLPGCYDLVISLETLKYLDHEQIDLVVANICAATSDVLISCDPTGLDGGAAAAVQPAEMWADLFGQHGFFRDVDFDVWFISPWAIRFRKQNEPASRLAANYERRLSPALRENQNLRARLNVLSNKYDQEIEQLKAENAVIPALNQQVQSLTRRVNELSGQIAEWDNHWAAIQHGMAWRLVQALVRIQPRLAPRGSRRYRAVQWLFETTRKTARRMRGQAAEIPVIAAPPAAGQAAETPAIEQISQPTYTAPLLIAYFTSDPWTAACAHLRVVGPGSCLNSGISILTGTNWEAEPVLEFPEQSQAVLIQRDFPRHEQLCQEVIAWASSTSRPIIYELDDLLTELPQEHPERNYYLEVRPHILEVMRAADAIIVATLPLADYARQYNPNTWVLPNYLDDRLWRASSKISSPVRIKRQPVVIGYMGGLTKTHLPDLELVTPTLMRLLRRYHGRVQLRFWGLLPPELEGIDGVEFRSERFPNYLEFASFFSGQNCDLFIAPLQDSRFNRCKSPIKFLEYSALGIPGIYSRIAPYSSIVVDGVNGLLAGDEYEWDDKLNLLVENPKLRRQLGQAAHGTIEKYFQMSHHAHEWGTIYRAALAAAGNHHLLPGD